MAELLLNRTTAYWLVLIALTALSLEFFRHLGIGIEHRPAAVIVVLIAFLKVRIVGLEYMELRSAPLTLRLPFEGWMLTIATIIIVTLLMA